MPGNDAALICLVEITGPHGLKGEVRVRSFAETPSMLGAYGPLRDKAGRRFKVRSARPASKVLVVRFDGVDDREAAESLKGTKLYVERSRLPEPEPGEFYHADLIGLAVERSGGEPLGTVTAVQNFGAGDLLEVALADGGTELIPFISDYVPDVDLAAGRVVADPPPSVAAEAANDA